MAFVKEAVLRLKLEGFDDAEKRSKALAEQLDRIDKMPTTLVAPKLPAVGPSGRAAGGAGAAGGSAGGPLRAGAGANLGAALDGVEKRAAAVKGSFDAIGTATKNMRAVGTVAIGALGASVAAFGLATAGAFAGVSSGMKAGAVADSFARMSGGSEEARSSLETLRQATRGAVSDTDLMTGANRIMAAQLNISNEKLAQITTAAQTLGASMGIGAADAYGRLTLAIAKQEPELLDELGIKVDLNRALSDEAQRRGVAVASLDAQARAQIFANAVADQAVKRSAEMGGTLASQGSVVERLSATWSNLVDRFNVGLAQNPRVVAALDAISAAAVKLADALMPIVETLIEIWAGAAQAGAAVVGGIASVFGGSDKQGSVLDKVNVSPQAAVKSDGKLAKDIGKAMDERDREILAAVRGGNNRMARALDFGGV